MMIEYLFVALILVLPFQFALNAGSNADLAITRVIIPVVFLLWLFRGLAKKKIWISNKAETWLILIFLFFVILSVFFGEDSGKSYRKLMYFFTTVPFFFVAADLLLSGRFRQKVAEAMVISGTMAAVLGVVQFCLQFIVGLGAELKYTRAVAPFFLGQSLGKLVENNPSWLVNVSGNTLMRAFGLFPDPHSFSVFVSLCFFVAVGYVASKEKRRFRGFAIFGLTVMLLAVLLSFSRGAYLGILGGIIFFLAAMLGKKNMLGKILIVLVFVILAMIISGQSSFLQRFSSSFNMREGSNAERIKNWKQAVEIIVSRPLTGVGIGNYASQIDPLAGERSSIYAHDIFLDIAAETGIINGIVFALLILIPVFRFLKEKDVLGFGLGASLIYFLVHGIFDTPIWSPQVMVLLLVILAFGFPLTKHKNQILDAKISG
ncbi:MAG: O-antigen ligase family protein [Parcubacteria group bacterium]|jgi:O-antigen ligase